MRAALLLLALLAACATAPRRVEHGFIDGGIWGVDKWTDGDDDGDGWATP